MQSTHSCSVVSLFALNLDATQIAAVADHNRNTINRYLRGIRERIAEYCESQSEVDPITDTVNQHL